MPWSRCFFKRKKVKIKIVFTVLIPQCQILFLTYPISMVYKKPSLKKTGIALERIVFQMQENYGVDEHDHPVWHHNLKQHTCVRRPLSCRAQTLLT